MKNFIEKLNNLFGSITSKKDAKPDTYAYETWEYDMDEQCNSNAPKYELLSNCHLITTTDFDSAIEVLEEIGDYHDDLERETLIECTQTEMYSLTKEILKEYFDCDSAEEFIDIIKEQDEYEPVYKSEFDYEEYEFYRLVFSNIDPHGFYNFLFAIEDGELYFGKKNWELEEYTNYAEIERKRAEEREQEEKERVEWEKNNPNWREEYWEREHQMFEEEQRYQELLENEELEEQREKWLKENKDDNKD